MMQSIRLIHSWRRALWQMAAILVFAGIAAVSVNALRPEPLPLIGFRHVEKPMTTVSGERLDIPLEQAARLFQDKAVVFIDARPAADYARGHIQGALNLPFGDVDRLFLSVTADLSPETPVVTYCDGETCSLSHDLAVFLQDMGFTNVKVLVNGWTRWKQAGLPITMREAAATTGQKFEPIIVGGKLRAWQV